MSLQGMKVKDIMEATGISRMTIFRIKSNWEYTGRVVRKSLENGRPRALSFLKVSVCALLGHWQSNLLRQLSTELGVDVFFPIVIVNIGWPRSRVQVVEDVVSRSKSKFLLGWRWHGSHA